MTRDPETEILQLHVDDAFVRNYHTRDKWLSAVIKKKTDSVSYRVRLANST